MSISEEFDFRKKTQNARESLYRRNAQILFKEYFIELVNKFSQDADIESQKEILKILSGAKHDVKKYDADKDKLSEIAEQKYFKEDKKEKPELPQDILNMSSELSEKLRVFFEVEKDYLEKLTFCEEIKKQILSLNKKLLQEQSENFETIIKRIIENLLLQQTETEQEVALLQEKYDKLDMECLREFGKLLDALDRNQKGI